VIPRVAYHAGTRGLHRAGPFSTSLLLAGMLATVLASGSLLVQLGTLLLVFLLAGISGESVRRYLISLRFVWIFAVVLFVAQALSIREGVTVFRVGFAITDLGLLSGGAMALRFLVILSGSFLFVLVTDPDRLAQSIIRLGVPYRYGHAVILALRFVPFFRNELRTVREAQKLRGIKPSVRSISGLRQTIRYTFVPVLVSGLLRVDSIAMSMIGRCFGLHPRRTTSHRIGWSAADTLTTLLAAVLIGVTVVSRRYPWL